MISLKKVTKYYPSALGNQYIFRELSFEIPRGHNIAILGANGSGKSTLFRLIAGSEYPSSGHIRTDVSLSWPVALATGIHPQMTGRENARFIARINGVENLFAYEERILAFSELGVQFDLPVKSYSSGMRSRLAFACSIGIDFDVYLIDEVTSVGDAKFRSRAKEALMEIRKGANIIMVSHQMNELRHFCDSAIVLDRGQLTFHNDLEQGIKRYQAL
ncbi:ABC transporter ATP-binding protein [Alteromonas oceanisediminis]|uniref:ABC transporter ATP-binding protein n=1 Tax=Alteromonas oceanisediminis TaxID=2836180 RepID=UPI001BDA768E|nr:ABC transporter ATP-binding protein [Alteromonas oceanisediminis]MBT0585061.1 ABC transporter ATP-binding protein [Alteromonas oceanisediminis]